MLFLLLAMALAMFLPYGSLHYRLAWLYLIVFFVPVLFITAYLFLFDKHLLESRLAVGPVAEPTVTQKLIQSAAGVAFIGVYILSALDYRYKWSDVPLYLSYVGDAFCVLAFVFLFYVFKANTFLSATIEVQEEQQVISTGLYGVVRHPMYTGALVLLFFTPLALGSFWGLVAVMVLAAVIIFRAIDEERELKAKLTGYEEYCNKVRFRLIPFIF
ncbi:membrane protein [Puia dinghuensis]|uniref:Membrane protein n=2 Tax=Puia dinghuensis TaxID=1792502 RepID=A0A8J2UE41_9BACT|nr:membrane protein [Puia dinghuensis]